MRGLFITGTGTEVGKTFVAAAIARQLVSDGLRVGVYKPVASGCAWVEGQLVADDAVVLWEAAGRPGRLEQVCPQRFAAPLAPPLAAEAEGLCVDRELLRSGIEIWQEKSDILIVEGAGGLMSPMSADDYHVDLAAEFGFPLVVVAPNALGTINATLQTLITAAAYRDGIHNGSPNKMRDGSHDGSREERDEACRKGLEVVGVVLNDVLDFEKSGTDQSIRSNREELESRSGVPLLAELAYGADRFDREVDWVALASR